jgi:hypothetical protein
MADSKYFRPSDNIASAGTLTMDTGSADATFGLTRLYDGSLTSPLKITPSAGVVAFKWDFGGSTRDIAALVIANHNLPATATIFIQGNATDSWGSPTFSQALAAPSAPDTDGIGRTNWYECTMSAAFRWVRVVVTTNAPTPTVIGEVMLSETSRSWPTTAAEYQAGVSMTELRPQIATYSAGGAAHVFADPTKVNLYEGFVRGTYTQLESVRDWYGYALGMAKPFPIYVDTLARADVVRFDHFDLRRDHVNGTIWDCSIRLRSESHGPGW